MTLADRAVEIFRRAVKRMDPAALCAHAAADVPGDRVRVLAVGKASLAMARGAARALQERMAGGIVIAPSEGMAPEGLELMIAAHPVPDERSQRAGEALLAAASECDVDTILFLISGGASALAAVPAAGLTLVLKRDALAALYAAGAPIDELNCARKHLSAIKGGRLSAVAPVPMVTLVVSDVAGDDLSVVGSGPSVPDPTTFAQALEIFARYLRPEDLAPKVRAHLLAGAAGDLSDTPSTPRPRDRAVLLAGMRSMVDAALDEARCITYDAIGVADDLVGDVTVVADRLVSLLPEPGRCVVACGEATIALPASPGRGGRAQHIALLVAKAIAGRPNVAVLVCGTDGLDGNSDAAGAVVGGDTWAAICATGIDPDQALARADAGTALAAVGATVITGPTGVNHADLMLVLCGTE